MRVLTGAAALAAAVLLFVAARWAAEPGAEDASPEARPKRVVATPDGGAGSSGRSRARAARPEAASAAPAAQTTGPRDAVWDAAKARAAEGRPLEALELVVAARRKRGAAWIDPARVREMLAWEVAALDAFEAALDELSASDAAAWATRLAKALLDPASRRRLDALRRRMAEAGKLDLAAILGGAPDAASLAALRSHLTRFGRPQDLAGDAPEGDPPAGEPAPLDDLLGQVRRRDAERARAAAPSAEPLPRDDEETREQRRLEQLEKLRQRSAEGLLEPIAAGLAWLALHQGDDGDLSADAVRKRCAALRHEPPCSHAGGSPRYPLASTALTVLALLDFRDQDAVGVFEPTLARAVDWLARQVREDGSFRAAGYESAIALMALGQAAGAGRTPALLETTRRSLWFHAGNVSGDGGFRYSFGQPGDLSVTAWYVQTLETAREAGVELPGGFADALERFVRSTWLGGPRFSYLAGESDRHTLSSVGALSLLILDPEAAAGEAEGWSAALAAGPPPGIANLYSTYYDVRVELALRGELSETRRAVLDALPRTMQVRALPAAGMFSSRPVDRTDRQSGGAPAWENFGNVRTAGAALVTAFCVLTMEHALYRR